MPFYPQLTTGAVAQFPVSKRRALRTVLETAPGGNQVKLADPGVDIREWIFDYTGLSGQEVAALEALFESSEGGLREFVFLDPMANLLTHSEDFSQPAWVKSALLQVTPGVADPIGTARASRLTAAGGTDQTIGQDIAGPGGFWYCISCSIRAVSGTSVTLRRSAGTASSSEIIAIGPEWKRVTAAARLESSATPVRFELRIPAGSVIDVFGMQVDAQRGASDYKKTGSRGGVYSNALFARDELEISATAANQFAATVHIRTW